MDCFDPVDVIEYLEWARDKYINRLDKQKENINLIEPQIIRLSNEIAIARHNINQTIAIINHLDNLEWEKRKNKNIATKEIPA